MSSRVHTLRYSYVFVAGLLWPLASCSNESGFKAGKVPTNSQLVKAEEQESFKRSLGFRFVEADGKRAERARGKVPVRAELTDLSSGKVLSPEVTRGWKVTIRNAIGVVFATDAEPGLITLDFPAPALKETLTATFVRPGEPQPGRASLDLLFDLAGIDVASSWTPATQPGSLAKLTWTLSSPGDLDEAQSAGFVCPDEESAATLEKEFLSGGLEAAKAAGCVVIVAGADAFAKNEFVVPAGGLPFPLEDDKGAPRGAFVFATSDKAQNRLVRKAALSDVESTTLALASSSPRKLSVSRKAAAIPLTLMLQDASGKKALSAAQLAATLLVVAIGSKPPEEVPFADSLALDAKTLVEGPQKVRLHAYTGVGKDRIQSSELEFDIIVDTLAPVVSAPIVTVEGGQISAGTTLSLQWFSSDASSVASHRLEWRRIGATTWEELAKAEGGARSARVLWAGSETLGAAQFRIVAVDGAGHEGISPVATWREQFFNAAVLTKSVECFWCHLKISGDVAAIFPASPANPAVHGEVGNDFSITGRFFSNVEFPGAMMPAAVPAPQRVANYANQDLPIFPKNNAWPSLDASSMRTKMTGLLKGRDPVANADVAIDRWKMGNVVLVGTSAKPIEIMGEVFIDGDVVLAGVFSGIGTIYANNVFVASDLIARSSPFPFPDDANAALAAARAAMGAKKDALYLVALTDVVVGAPESMSTDGCSPVDGLDRCPSVNVPAHLSSPYGWLPKPTFQSLGKRASAPVLRYYDITTGVALDKAFEVNSHGHPEVRAPNGNIVDDFSSDRTAMEVSRVDSFLYAGRNFQARQHVNIVINGGVMSPKLDLLTSVTRALHYTGTTQAPGYRFGNAAANETPPVNPANGIPYKINEIRYDWRLRAGGPGLEVLKTYFNP